MSTLLPQPKTDPGFPGFVAGAGLLVAIGAIVVLAILLTAEKARVAELRSEIARMRLETAEKEKVLREVRGARHGVDGKKACIANLNGLQSAKEQWAMDNRKSSTDTPTLRDLIGPNQYIKEMPRCPEGGTYGIYAVSTDPSCSIHGTAASYH